MKSTLFLSIVLVLFIAGCQAGRSDEAQKLTDSTSITGMRGDSVKLVKSAAINCKVKDVHEGVKSVSALANRLGGMITHQNITASEDGRKELKLSKDSLLLISTFTPRADVTVRVPVQHLEEFLFTLSDSALLFLLAIWIFRIKAFNTWLLI